MKQFDYIRVWETMGEYDTIMWVKFISAAPNEELIPLISWFRYDHYTT